MWNDECRSALRGDRTALMAMAARASGAGAGRAERRTSGHSVGLAGKVDALRTLAAFRDGGDDGLARLAEASSLRRLRRGQRLARGQVGDNLLAVLRGFATASVDREAPDAEMIVDLLATGATVSDWCWGGSGFASHGAVTSLEDALVLLAPRKALETFLLGDGSAAIRLLDVVATARARAVALAVQNASLSVGDRLYCRLVELSHLRGRKSAEGLLVEHGLAQWQLAAFSSASRENVNRALGEWRGNGWIGMKRGAILVRDPGALTGAASPLARRVGFGAGDGRLPLPKR